ncbi:hypothetical protein Q1695_000855 [Nippostrongylus brasiliensis]|nr:hypothetical protein Q1695_000855 [Nippostrongylus brasiliensis]
MDPTWSAKSSTRSSARSSSNEDDDILVEPVPFKRVKQEHFDFWTDEHRSTLINEVSSYPELWDVKLPSYKDKQSWDPLENNGKTYVPTQFLLRSVDTGRRMCNVGASTTSGISRSYRDVDLETNEARVVEFPPRKHSEASSSSDAAISQVCNTLQSLRSTRRQEDEHDGFGITRSTGRATASGGAQPSVFYSYARLYPEEFENLHERLARRLSHFTSHRAPIPSRHRLCLFLRFIAHGTSYAHLSGEFAIGRSTACPIAREVAHAIVDELHDLAFPIPTLSTWRNAEEQFCTQWDYPAAMGALDGKQIACVCPSRSGSSFFNYKGHYSIVLLALVHANYRCILYDLGASGRSSDAGVFMTSPMKTYIEEHDADFPSPVQLGHIGKVPCHFLVDQGFRLTTRFIRPYSDAEASSDSKSAYFNFKLSRARRVVENYFGILANRFRILLRPRFATPENIKTITRRRKREPRQKTMDENPDLVTTESTDGMHEQTHQTWTPQEQERS